MNALHGMKQVGPKGVKSNNENKPEHDSTTGCLFPRGPAGITRKKSEEGHRKYWMKITLWHENKGRSPGF